jgi:hypothetical protein
MTQTILDGTRFNDLLDASALTTTAILHGGTGSDTLLGGSGNDRLDGGLGADLMRGGGGNDQFFAWLGNDLAAGQRDTIEGGSGSDELIINLKSTELTSAAVQADITLLRSFLADHGSDQTAHFITDALHFDLSGVEQVRLRVDGVLKTLAEAEASFGPPINVVHAPITFEDLNVGNAQAIPDGYKGFDWKVPGENLYAMQATTNPGSGYETGSVSPGSWVAFNPYALAPIDIQRHDHGDFILDKLSATSAFNVAQDVVFRGYNNGVLVGEDAVTLNSRGPTLVDVAWGTIDDLQIHVLNGNRIVLDNLYMY